MKILHTADWHLGKTLNNFNLLEDQRYVLDNFIAIAKAEKPDVILLAGDIYDRSLAPAEAVTVFDEVMSALILDLKIPVIAIAGNHDSAERVNYCNYLLKRQGLHIFGSVELPLKPVIMTDAFGEVYFYSIPYTDPETLRFLTKDDTIRTHEDTYRYLINQILENHPQEKRKVLIGHAFVSGGAESESERQLLVGGAAQIPVSLFQDFDYVALGHLHQPQTFLEGRLVYAGSVLKYSFSEVRSNKSVVLVNLDAKGFSDSQKIALKPLRDVQKIRGVIENREFRVSEQSPQVQAKDFLEVTLENEEIVPNAMQIIQKSYEHTMALKWANLYKPANQHRLTTEKLAQMNEIDLFADFYQRFKGKDLDMNKQKIIKETITEITREENEG
jgi:exonuclease SbcD